MNAMNLTIPVPGSTPGPQYASDISNDLATVSDHTHTGSLNNDGNQIPSAGLNINADLSINSHNLTSLRSTRYTSQSSTLSGIGDIDCVYFKSGELWINDGSGNPVQITSGGVVYSTVTNNYATTAITGNLTINPASNTVVISCDSSSSAIIVTLPAVSAVPTGRFYLIKDKAGASATNSITINPTGSDHLDNLTTWVINSAYEAIGVASNGSNGWILFLYDRKKYKAGDVIQLTGGASLTSDSSSPVALGGALAAGPTTITGTLGVSQDVTLSQELHVTGTSTLGGDCYVGKELIVTELISGSADAHISGITKSDSFEFKSDITGIVRYGSSGGIANPANWAPNVGYVVTTWENLSTATVLNFQINPPNKVLLKEVSIYLKGATGHVALPTNMPKISLVAYEVGVSSTLVNGYDTSTTLAQYENWHEIKLDLTSSSITVHTDTSIYGIMIQAEYGANSIIGAEVIAYSMKYDRLADSLVGQD